VKFGIEAAPNGFLFDISNKHGNLLEHQWVFLKMGDAQKHGFQYG